MAILDPKKLQEIEKDPQKTLQLALQLRAEADRLEALAAGKEGDVKGQSLDCFLDGCLIKS